MKLEAVTICAGYGDFLAETIQWNRGLFDRWVVVTSPDDDYTQRLCEYHHVMCLQSHRFGTERGEFHKAKGINDGLAQLGLDGWVLHLDADIALPPLARYAIETADLDPSMLYGADRHTILGWDKWAKHCARPELQQECGVYVHVDPYPVATRFAPFAEGGYVPIGFFQLWNPAASGVRSYPEDHSGAGRTDMLFATKWPRAKRAMLPELVTYHLESEAVPQGANWSGRTTKPFGPERHRPRWWHRHRHHRRPCPTPPPHPYLGG